MSNTIIDTRISYLEIVGRDVHIECLEKRSITAFPHAEKLRNEE
jgi:hypothetical protein